MTQHNSSAGPSEKENRTEPAILLKSGSPQKIVCA